MDLGKQRGGYEPGKIDPSFVIDPPPLNELIIPLPLYLSISFFKDVVM